MGNDGRMDTRKKTRDKRAGYPFQGTWSVILDLVVLLFLRESCFRIHYGDSGRNTDCVSMLEIHSIVEELLSMKSRIGARASSTPFNDLCNS